MVGGRGLDQGGPGRRPRGRRVDDRRQPRDRPHQLRHRPLLPAPAHPRARQGAHRRGVQQDLRHRAPRRAVGQRPRQAARPDARQPAASWARCSSRPSAGSARSGTPVQRGAARRLRRPGAAARARVGLPLVVADHQRRAPGHARPRRRRRPVGVRDLRRGRPAARWTPCRASSSPRPTSRVGPGGLHPGARRARRLPLRPDDHAAGPRPLPGRHRRRARHGRPQVVRRPDAAPTARRRSSTRPRRTRRSGCGDRGPATSSARSPTPTSATRASASAAAARSRSARCRCWRRGSRTSASWAGSCTCPIEQGARLWDLVHEAGRPARRGAGRASASTPPPAGSRRATGRSASSSTPSARSSRPA